MSSNSAVKPIQRIAVMTSGGDSPGMNAAIRAVVRYALHHGIEVMGIQRGFFGLVNDDLARLRFEASNRPGFHESYSAMFPAPRQRWVDALASDEQEIAAIEQETLIVHGRDDQVIPVESSLRLSKLISRSQLHVFGRCGHWTQIEHAGRFAQLVSNFLAEA